MLASSGPSAESGGRPGHFYLMLAILIIAATVRLWGIQHDLPFSYYGDEVGLINRALAFGSGDLNPHRFVKPPFYQYLLFFKYGVYYVAGRLFGLWSSVADFAVSYVNYPAPFILIGRLTTFLFSLASVWCVYLIGERHLGKHVGLIAMLLLTLSAGHVAASQVVKADIASACFGIWSAYFLLNFVRDGQVRNVMVSCVLAGMGAATKYYTIPMLLPEPVAVLVGSHAHGDKAPAWRRRLGTLFLAVVAFAGSFFMWAPYHLLDPEGRKETVRLLHVPTNISCQILNAAAFEKAENGDASFVVKRKGVTEKAVRYLGKLSSPAGMGIGIASLSIIGLAAFFYTRTYAGLILSLYPIFFGMTSAILKPNISIRHQLSLYGFLVIAGGALIVALANRLGSRSWLVYGALLIMLIPPALRVGQRGIEMSREETRNVAKAWIEQNIPAETKLVVDEEGPPLRMTRSQLESLISIAGKGNFTATFTANYDTYLKYQLLAVKDQVAYELHEIRFPWWRGRFVEYGYHTLSSEYDSTYGNPLKPVRAARGVQG